MYGATTNIASAAFIAHHAVHHIMVKPIVVTFAAHNSSSCVLKCVYFCILGLLYLKSTKQRAQ